MFVFKAAVVGTGELGEEIESVGVKATLAVHNQVIPPATGHYDPHPLLLEDDAAMFVPTVAGQWPDGDYAKPGVVCTWRLDGRAVGS